MLTMTTDLKPPKGRASEFLKERKYGAQPSKLEKVLGPAQAGKLKRRLLAYVPGVIVYFLMREFLAFDIISAVIISTVVVGLTYFTLAPIKKKE